MTLNVKPQLAEDAILDAVQFPVWVQPKIDGVRGMNLAGKFTGRSLDEFAGYGITSYFSTPPFLGLDGEMTLGPKPNCTERLCSMTTGAMGRFKGVDKMADLHLWCFDYLTPDTINLLYHERYRVLRSRLEWSPHDRLHLVPYTVAHNANSLAVFIAQYADEGYEGTIIRNPYARYKPGRATKKGQELWRVKPWADAEILVTGVTEGEANGNAAQTNTLGRTERSSAKAGMVPNGQVGSIQGTMLADFHDPFNGVLMFRKGLPITVSSGEMSVAEATMYFVQQQRIVGHVVKFKHMTHGVKDKPRFPTYISHRLAADMSTT